MVALLQRVTLLLLPVAQSPADGQPVDGNPAASGVLVQGDWHTPQLAFAPAELGFSSVSHAAALGLEAGRRARFGGARTLAPAVPPYLQYLSTTPYLPVARGLAAAFPCDAPR